MKLSFLAFLLFAVCVAPMAAQAARIDILPRKIFVDERQRSADITILNLGNKPSFVRITLLSYKQKEDGTYEEITGPLSPAFDPERDVRISPKQFTLPAGGRQKIRLSIQKPAELPDGEYRFHVKAISFDQEDSSVRRTPEKNASVALKMNVAVVIPVVFHKGALSGGAKIGNISFVPASQSQQGLPALKFDRKLFAYRQHAAILLKQPDPVGQHLANRPANDRTGRAADDLARRWVEVDDPILHIEHNHPVGHLLDDAVAGDRGKAQQPVAKQAPGQKRAGQRESDRREIERGHARDRHVARDRQQRAADRDEQP